MRFWKGHGTENDFVLLLDPDGGLELTDSLVARLCDRRAGIGADGVLRVVRARACGEAVAGGAEWFMDHRNADGGRPEMCGNGIRLFAHFLLSQGLAQPGGLAISTRGGLKQVTTQPAQVTAQPAQVTTQPAQVTTQPAQVTVDMGPAVVGDPVLIDGAGATFVDLGNPHAVLAVPSLAVLGELHPDRLDLNVEYVQRISPTHLNFRVHERGVGETRSCGTGACAVVVADSLAGGAPRGTPVTVDVLGGRLVVTWREDGHVLLAGPAQLVAAGELDPGWLAGHR